MSLLQEATRFLANQVAKKHLNAFITLADRSAVLRDVERASANAGGSLNGRLIAVKDNICTKDSPTTSASGILRSFTSAYDATVVSRLRDAGAIVTGKTNLDEFGMGSHSTHSYFGAVSQESGNGELVSAGGSSGGSAVAVATDQCWAALGTDTGGSVRLPAAYTGTVGFKPSYGMLSRWGVLAYANSLDTVGIVSIDVGSAREVFSALNAHDKDDPTSLPNSIRKPPNSADGAPGRPLRIGVPKEYYITQLSGPIKQAWQSTLSVIAGRAKSHGHAISIHPVSLPSTHQALSAYYILAPAEASSNLAKYDGVRYGSRATSDAADGTPLFSQTRGQGFGDEVRRRILLGTYSLSAAAMENHFIQAQKVRRLVVRDFNRAFKSPNPLLRDPKDTCQRTASEEDEGVDVLLHPTAPTLPPTLEVARGQSGVEAYMNDVFTVPASLAGLPAISIPVPCVDERGEEVMCGMQIVGQFGQDERVLDVAAMVEKMTGKWGRRKASVSQGGGNRHSSDVRAISCTNACY